MKKLYRSVCKGEEAICGAMLCIIVALAFLTALGRCVNHPISWTNDISQLLLAWIAFFGADMGLRAGRVLGVDLLTRRLPVKVQAVIRLVTNVLIIITLVAFVKYGFGLCISNIKRSYKAVGLSYSWATASLPVCSILMTITIVIESVQQVRILLGHSPAKSEEAE